MERCQELGLKCEFTYNGAKEVVHKDATAFIIAILKTN
jgi:hypothetical protein